MDEMQKKWKKNFIGEIEFQCTIPILMHHRLQLINNNAIAICVKFRLFSAFFCLQQRKKKRFEREAEKSKINEILSLEVKTRRVANIRNVHQSQSHICD